MKSPIFDFTYNLIKFGFNPKFTLRVILYYFKFLMLEPFRLLEILIWRSQIKKYKFDEPPVFILGYYRSGTTHLQEVLMSDSRFGYMNFFQCLLTGGFLLTESWLKPILNPIAKLMGVKHPAHGIDFNFDLPAEEDVALVSSGYRYAPNWGQVFAKEFKPFFNKFVFFEECSSEERESFKKELNNLLVRVAIKNEDKKMLFKSPPQTARVKLIKEMYPNAKIIYIHRNPYDVFKSNQKLWKSFYKHCLQDFSSDEADENILWSMKKCYDYYEKDKEILSKDDLVEVSFDEMQTRPLETFERIYSTLGIGGFENAKVKIASYLEKKHKGHPKPYKFTDAEIEKIEFYLEDYIKNGKYKLA